MIALRDPDAVDSKEKLYLECECGDSVMVIERNFGKNALLKDFDNITFWMHSSESVRTNYDNSYVFFPKHAIKPVLETILALKDATKFTSHIFELDMTENANEPEYMYFMIDNYESHIDNRTKKIVVAPSEDISISCFKSKEDADESLKMLYNIAGRINIREPLHLWSLTINSRQTKILIEWAEIAYREFCELNEADNKS